MQALDRTQPGLPMKKGSAGTITHDYKPHGTTTLFAALNVLDGTVIGQNKQPRRHSQPNQARDAGRQDHPRHLPTTTPPTRRTRFGNGSIGIRAGPSTSSQPPAPGSMPSRGSSPSSPGAGSSTASSTPSSISRPPSTASFRNTMPQTQNPSSGKPTPNHRRSKSRVPDVGLIPLGPNRPCHIDQWKPQT